MRVLVLVLASDTYPIYTAHQRIWRSYMNLNPNVDCYFYKGDPTLKSEAELKGDTLFLRIEDTIDTVHQKTLMAFKYFLPLLPKYKCVFRTNLSSVVIFDRYIEYCKAIPDEAFCSAVVGEEDGRVFPSGSGYTIIPYLVRKYVDLWPPVFVQDDLTLGGTLHDWGISITPAARIDILNESRQYNIRGSESTSVYHFRVKQIERGDDWFTMDNWETNLMKNIVRKYYGPLTWLIQ